MKNQRKEFFFVKDEKSHYTGFNKCFERSMMNLQ